MCIASLTPPAEGSLSSPVKEGGMVDSLRLLLALRFGTKLNLRELPVSLLRLYFSGQQHFAVILRRLSHSSFYYLLNLAERDGLTLPPPSRKPRPPMDPYEDPLYQRRRELVGHYLCGLLDLTFCSFERTLSALLCEGHPWLQGDLYEALREDPYWKGFPQPSVPLPSSRKDLRSWLREENHSIWYTVVWRMNVTLLVEKYLKPWQDDKTRDWLLYRMQLFRDTHLDILTVMVKDECYDDRVLVISQALGTHYPISNRVCCAEELPDMLPYALDNFKSGTHLKERTTMQEKMGHLNVIKRFNNICKDRNDWEIIRACGEQDPVIYDHLKYTIRCVMLGNLPGARGSLSAIARVRVNLSFWTEYADRVMSREEIDAYMHPYCNPYCTLAQRREQKLKKETEKCRNSAVAATRLKKVMATWDAKENVKMTYEKTHFKMWLIKCRYFVSSLLKEMLLHIQESNGCLDRYLALDFKWLQYKNIIRLANGQCRNELSRQAGEMTLSQAFDWSIIEYIEKSPDAKYDIKRGKIMAFHNVALKVAKKVLKRNFIGIVEVKATGIEERILLDKSRPPQPVVSMDGGEEEGLDEMTLQELHFICYCMGTQESPILQSSLFQAMGMSRAGLEVLRKWLLYYYAYDIADDSLKEEILAFQRADPRDYFLLKTVFRLIQFYRRREHIFHLPAKFALRQFDAVRRQLAICDWEVTPPELGIHYRCHGCQKFANGIVKPLNYPHHSNHSELVYPRFQVYTAAKPAENTTNNLSLRYENHRPRDLELHTRKYALECTARVEKKPPTTTTTVVGTDGKVKRKEGEEEEEEEDTKKSISFLNVAFYNNHDGKPYCIKNRRRRVAGGIWSAVDCEKSVIMSSPDGQITVSCNRIPVERSDGEELSEEDRTRRKRKRGAGGGSSGDEDDDDEDGGDGDEEGGNEEADGVRQPGYETDLLSLFTDLKSVTRSNRDSLEQFAKQRARELAQNMGKKGGKASQPVENNKKRIMNMVQEPIKAMYNCQVPLQPIDMIGIVKNGKVICVVCGLMTEYKNHNMTHYGPVCMRHISSTMQLNHPAWKTDLPTAQYLQQQQQQQQAKNRRHPLHPLALLQSRPGRMCMVCGLLPAEVSVTVRTPHYKLIPKECCGICHHNLRPLLGKRYVTPVRSLIQFAEQRAYKHAM